MHYTLLSDIAFTVMYNIWRFGKPQKEILAFGKKKLLMALQLNNTFFAAYLDELCSVTENLIVAVNLKRTKVMHISDSY